MRYLLLAVAVSFLSLPAILVRFAEAAVEPLGFWRLVIALCVLAPAAWRGRAGWRKISSAVRRQTAWAGVFFFTHLWLFTAAARHTSVANCMLGFSIHPLLTALGTFLLLREKPRDSFFTAFALAAAGIVLLATTKTSGTQSLAGDLAALASAAAFSGYVLCGQSARRGLDNAVFASVVYFCAATLFLLLGLGRGEAFFGYTARGWGAIAGLGLGVTVLGHALFTHLYAELDVNVLSLAKLVEPPAAAAIAAIAFGESLSGRAWLAFALVGAALVVSVYGANAKRSGSTPPA